MQDEPTVDGAEQGAGAAPAVTDCRNCGASLHGPFCHACSQRVVTVPLRLGELLAGSLRRFLSLESGGWATFVGMSLRPGTLVSEYLAGRRKSYAHPFKYYFGWLVVSLGLASLIGVDMGELGMRLIGMADPERAITDQFNEEAMRYLRTFADLMRWIALAQVPIYAVVQWLVFRKARRTIAEHLAVSFLVQGHATIVMVFQVLLCKGEQYDLLWASQWLTIAYVTYALTAAYRVGIWGGIWRSLLVVATASVLALVLTGVPVVLYVFLTGG